jgi:hypothetical protein
VTIDTIEQLRTMLLTLQPTIQCFELSNQGDPVLEQLYPSDENDDNIHTDANIPR